MKLGEKKLVCIDVHGGERQGLEERIGKDVDNIIWLDSHLGKKSRDSHLEGEKEIFLVLIPWRVWKGIPSTQGKKVLFIDEIKEELFEELKCVSQCIVGITSEGVHGVDDIKNIIKQATDLNTFIHNLKDEMKLYKNLYIRKSEQLEILKRLFSNIKINDDISEILKNTFFLIREFLNINSIAFVLTSKGKYYIHILDSGNSSKSRFLRFIKSSLSPSPPTEVHHYELPGKGSTGREFSEREVFEGGLEDKRVRIFMHIGGLPHLGEDTIDFLEMVAEYLAIVVERSIEYQQLIDAAYFDFLTGLGNRHFFDKMIHQEKKRHERLNHCFSILILDIDHFKAINDTYGHDVGDLILKEIGGIIKDSVREVDYPIRYGGEEFVIILPHTEKEQAFILADRLRERIESHSFVVDGNVLNVTVSIGVSEFDPAKGKDVDAVLKEADLALYTSKSTGRNKVSIYEPQP